jgi:hypothetical protein
VATRGGRFLLRCHGTSGLSGGNVRSRSTVPERSEC